MSIWTAFVLGLFGSLHCAGMCGPLAIALPAAGRSRISFVIGRTAYNMGRILTYCGIGLIFGLLGKTFVLAGIQQWVSITLGIVLLAGLAVSKTTISAIASGTARVIEKIKRTMRTLLYRNSWISLMLLGLLNGLLPCGLVYVAAGAATMTTSVFAGAEYMFFFGLGTLPMLFAIALSRTLFPINLRLKLIRAVPVSVFILGILLILRGLSLGIPYISPDLASGSCCHTK